MTIFSEERKEKPLILPSDVYAQNILLITDHEATDPASIQALLSKRLALANIEEKDMTIIYGERWGLVIIPLFQIWLREKNNELKNLYEWFLFRSLAELKLTEAHGSQKARLLVAKASEQETQEEKEKQKVKYKRMIEEGEYE